MTEATINKHCNSPELPWPTTLLKDATESLERSGALAPAVAKAARRLLDTWLGKLDGPIRNFCRELRPCDLAACALQKAVQED